MQEESLVKRPNPNIVKSLERVVEVQSMFFHFLPSTVQRPVLRAYSGHGKRVLLLLSKRSSLINII